jgi:kynurenine formamidase
MRGLEQLPDEGFTFSALPPKFKGAGTFPVRALAKVSARRTGASDYPEGTLN